MSSSSPSSGGMSSTSSVSSARFRRSRVGLHYSSCSYHQGSPVIVVGVRTPLLPTELRFGDVPDLMCGSRVRGGGSQTRTFTAGSTWQDTRHYQSI